MHSNPRSTVFLATSASAFILLNVGVGLLMRLLRAPVYLDMTGTAVAGLAFGPLVAAIIGVVSMLISGLAGNASAPYYSATAALVGICAGLAGHWHLEKRPARLVLAAVVTAVVAAIASAPITAYLFGGATGAGSDLLVAVMRRAGADLYSAVMSTGILVEVIDKVIVFALAGMLVRSLPQRIALRFPLLRREIADSTEGRDA